ncbi:hypothetical protein HXX76_005422 [Chlamydomonas incerta]|uniref:Uncharacterized protein n=1 Tax=Chlamydomonas incerta TaxID=51695 RepID=A0A835W259_CHLIN|nr:hypothetical protein HXX76_005422 [Chlamydomonas incerta]|eukprot:KAG2437802.1 hypothetical protein HXX76_005422 [Chlamydomonas incerta]
MEAGTRRLLAALGEAVRSGRQVSVDFGVGTLTGRDRALGFDFLPSYLAVHRTMAGSTRPGGAWASAAVGARRTAQQQQRQAAQQAPQQPPQTRREQVLAGLAQLQAELEAVEDGDAADEGGGVDFRDQALPGAPTQRWQRRESLPGEEAPGRQQQAGQRRAMSQPRRPLSQGPEAQGRRCRFAAIVSWTDDAQPPAVRWRKGLGCSWSWEPGDGQVRWAEPVQQQDTAEPAANAAAGAGPAGESPVRRVSYDGGPAGTSGDIDVEDQQAPRSARKPLFVSPSGCNSPSYAAEGNAKSNGLRGMQPDRPLLNAHAGKGVAAGGAEDGRLHAKADDCTPSRLGRERLRDRSSPLDRSPSPGPRSGSRGVIVTLAAVRSASPGPNLRYGGAGAAADATDMAASAGPPSLQRPVTEGRPAGRDACVAESWEAELEAELEDVEDLLGGVEQYLGFSADLPDPWAQNADGNPLGRGWAEAEGPRRAAQAGGNSSAGGCVEDWSSSGMACSSSANSCFSFGCGGVGQASNSSSLRNTVHGVAGGRTGGPQALVSSTHGGALRACQEEEEDVSAGDCDSLPMPPQCCDSPTRRQLRSSGSQGEGDVAPIAAQGRRSPGERYRGGSSSSSTGTSRNSGGLRGVSLAVGEEDLPGPAWGDRRQAPAGGPHAKNQQEDQNESEEEEEEEEEDWSGDDQIPEVQRYLKSMGQVRGNWRLSSDESDVE